MSADLVTPPNKKGVLKRFMPQTLLGRSLLILITPVLLIQIFATFIFFDRHLEKMTSRLAFAVAGEVAVIVSYLKDNNEQQYAIDRVTATADKNLDMTIHFNKGAVLEDGPHNSDQSWIWGRMIRRALSDEARRVLNIPYIVDVDFNEKWVRIDVKMSTGILSASVSQRRLFSSTSYIFLLWIFFASSILLIIAVLFMRNQIRPIRRLSIAADRFGKGQDVRDFKVEGAREVRHAGQAFLDMKRRIQRQISQRTDMLAGVSHDLRTPLTRLKLQIAMLGDDPDILEMKKDIVEMEKMIDGYLNFVRGEGREESVDTDLTAFISNITASEIRHGRKVMLNTNALLIHMNIKPVAFKRCLNNIISNAAKYSDHIWVTLDQSDEHSIHILIEDDGPGIDEAMYDDVFRPFYRVDSSRNVDTGGVGLGLPIAMDIVHAHGGEIELKKSPHGGLGVLISLPI